MNLSFTISPLNNFLTDIQKLLPRFLTLALLLGLIAIYWVVRNTLNNFLRKKTKLAKVYATQRFLLTIVTIFLTLFSIVIAFIDNLPVFFGSISVLSAALVFALQDFVSCLFAWLYIELSNQYEVGETVIIASDNRQIFGVVNEIGIFRTKIQEKLGGTSLDYEMPTGRVLTYPNNYIFKHSLTNVTKNHLLISHRFSVVITLETDYKKANRVLEKAVHQTFEQLVKRSDRYFDDNVTDLTNYIPQVYHSIEDSGINFTIWFGCRAGRFRQVLEIYTSNILDAFIAEGVELAYNTLRVIK
ncbi:MAG: mechanosensitive ion channel family protein [Candidatus Parcubacteria bacterium]|nr:mechanosensitive ion channel family protein [Candidatus Paceibacterota bacterium]